MTTQRSTRPADRGVELAAPRHDVRAWTAFLVAALLLLASVPLAGPAAAQLPVPLPGGSEEPTEEPSGEPTEEGAGLPEAPGFSQTAEGGPETAYYTSPTSFLLPETAVAEFPPGLVCLVAPDFCNDAARGVTAPIQDNLVFPAIGGLDTAGEAFPQPVPPGTLPVGILNGNQRYASAIRLALPEVPEGKEFASLTVTLDVSDASFALESPAFRTLVLGALAAYQTNDPAVFQEQLAKVGGEAPLLTPSFPGLEMCVIKSEWVAGEDQPVSAQPVIDPLFCSPSVLPSEDGTVTFDMTFPVNDSLPGGFTPGYEGVLVRPLGAQNLAYGDADYSTNYYAYLEFPEGSDGPAVASTLQDRPAAPAPSDGGGSPAPTGGSPSGGGSGTPSGGFGGGSSGGSSGRPSAPSSSGGSTTGSTPALAAPGAPGGSDVGETLAVPEAVEPLPADAAALGSPLDDATPTDVPSSAWIPWVLLPMLLGGALWYGRVLDASPVAQIVRAGAMTRLLRDRGFAV